MKTFALLIIAVAVALGIETCNCQSSVESRDARILRDSRDIRSASTSATTVRTKSDLAPASNATAPASSSHVIVSGGDSSTPTSYSGIPKGPKSMKGSSASSENESVGDEPAPKATASHRLEAANTDDTTASAASGDDDDDAATVDDDDDFLTPKNYTNPIYRPEPEQPENWSIIVAVLFTVVALVLCCMTGRKVMMSKRQQYDQVTQEATLVV